MIKLLTHKWQNFQHASLIKRTVKQHLSEHHDLRDQYGVAGHVQLLQQVLLQEPSPQVYDGLYNRLSLWPMPTRPLESQKKAQVPDHVADTFGAALELSLKILALWDDRRDPEATDNARWREPVIRGLTELFTNARHTARHGKKFHLDFTASPLGDAGVELLTQSSKLSVVHHLGLRFCGISDRGLRILIQCPYLENLTSLDIGNNQLSDTGKAYFLNQQPTNLPKLSQLNFI